jgi:adenine-specific DNA-methyltransferase
MPLGSELLEGTVDYLLWYAKLKDHVKYRPLYRYKSVEGDSHWDRIELLDGARRKMTLDEVNNHDILPDGAIIYQLHQLYPAGINSSGLFEFGLDGRHYRPPLGRSWKTNQIGMQRLALASFWCERHPDTGH